MTQQGQPAPESRFYYARWSSVGAVLIDSVLNTVLQVGTGVFVVQGWRGMLPGCRKRRKPV